MSHYLILFMAIPIGLVAGLLPGIGVSISLLTMYVLIFNLPFDFMIAFYISLVVSLQFSNTISGLYLGVLTDMSSIPILREREELISKGLLNSSIKSTAIASVIASLLSFCILLVMMYFHISGTWLFRTSTMFIFMSVLIVGCLFWKENRLYVNVILITLGIILGMVGYHITFGKTFFTFGQSWLYSGLPIVPVLIGVYVVPILFKTLNTPNILAQIRYEKNTKINLVRLLPYSIFGSITGFFLGLIPLLGWTFSPQVTHYIVSRMRGSNPLDRVNAVEAANNSTAVSIILPLLMLGIAIQPSEAILLNLLTKGAWNTTLVTTGTLVFCFVVVLVTVVVSYFICIHGIVHLIRRISSSSIKLIVSSLFFILVYNIYIVGSFYDKEIFYIIVFLISSIVGLILQRMKVSPIPLVFTMLITPHFIPVVLRMQQLYF